MPVCPPTPRLAPGQDPFEVRETCGWTGFRCDLVNLCRGKTCTTYPQRCQQCYSAESFRLCLWFELNRTPNFSRRFSISHVLDASKPEAFTTSNGGLIAGHGNTGVATSWRRWNSSNGTQILCQTLASRILEIRDWSYTWYLSIFQNILPASGFLSIVSRCFLLLLLQQ